MQRPFRHNGMKCNKYCMNVTISRINKISKFTISINLITISC